MPVKAIFLQLASCWGCHQSLLDLHEALLDVLPQLEVLFWHTVVDFKVQDIEKLPDGSVDVGFTEGFCRTEEDVHRLKLVRQKCKLLVSYGTCSTYGSIPSLLNLYPIDEALARKFLEAESVVDRRIPDKHVPKMLEYVRPNRQIVNYDFFLPGCPPEPHLIAEVVTALLKGETPKLKERTLCDECPRVKSEVIVLKKIKRDFEGIPEPEKCLLEQGYICMGPATREGCGAVCPSAGAPCKGCMGPGPNVMDQGAKMLSALASIVDYESISPEELVNAVKDVVGTFSRFTLPSSIIPKAVFKKK